jgi:hypothetical protein
MKKLIPLLLLFAACSKEEILISKEEQNYTLTIDSVLTQTGAQSLPKDVNGLYHLKLINSFANQQTHRITGRILLNGKEPIPNQKIEWESNLYWALKRGDTLANISVSYVNYFTGQFTMVKLPPFISQQNEMITTVNKASYNGSGGEINTMIAPVKEMKGDTMIIKATHSLSNKIIYTKIVLE